MMSEFVMINRLGGIGEIHVCHVVCRNDMDVAMGNFESSDDQAYASSCEDLSLRVPDTLGHLHRMERHIGR